MKEHKNMIDDVISKLVIREGTPEENNNKKKKNISYSCVLLDEASRKELLKLADRHDVPEKWERVAHHMTIKMGSLDDEFLENYPVDDNIELTVTHFGMSDKAAAVRVNAPHPTKTSFSHVTVAVNRIDGGKPFDSNKITEFKKIEPIVLTGTVKEISQ